MATSRFRSFADSEKCDDFEARFKNRIKVTKVTEDEERAVCLQESLAPGEFRQLNRAASGLDFNLIGITVDIYQINASDSSFSPSSVDRINLLSYQNIFCGYFDCRNRRLILNIVGRVDCINFFSPAC
jgi:hypothetical protein